jgi:hypothetical protein
MGDLTKAFEALRSVVTSCDLEFELERFDPNGATGVTRDLELPRDFIVAYASGSPAANSSVPWAVEQLFIFSVADIAAAQDGYRWSGPERRQLPGWSGNWVVVAAVFADPFFVDTSQSGFPVYFVRHGAGEWQPHRVAPTVAAFIAALGVSNLSCCANSAETSGMRAGFAPISLNALLRSWPRNLTQRILQIS